MALPLPLRNCLARLILDALHDEAARRALDAAAAVGAAPHALEGPGVLPEAFPREIFERRDGTWQLKSGFKAHEGEFAERAERARRFLDAERTRVVHSAELESVTGLTRYDLARQFRHMFGTSPYRYLLMRRLDLARELIHQQRPLVDVACDAGFADQAHFTRVFRSAFGLTPARYRALRAGQRV